MIECVEVATCQETTCRPIKAKPGLDVINTNDFYTGYDSKCCGKRPYSMIDHVFFDLEVFFKNPAVINMLFFVQWLQGGML